MGFQKRKPQVITCRSYKNFDNDEFQTNIKTCECDTNDMNSLKGTILSVFNTHAPIKQKYFRQDEDSFMTKTYIKELCSGQA